MTADDAHPDDLDLGRLRGLNLGAAALHGVTAVALLVLSTSVSLPVVATFATSEPGQAVTPERLSELFAYPLGPAVALFSALSALAHLVVASPWGWPRYRAALAAGRNRFRWVEYSVSASLMIVLIAGLTGISDIVALMGLAGVNASMIFFGWLMETTSRPGPDADWTPFVFGCFAGSIPWIAIAVYLVGAEGPPGFVYGIFVSLFIFFNCFALNQWLQYRKVGRWSDYLFGERTYVILSFTAKSVLAWQVFANVLTG